MFITKYTQFIVAVLILIMPMSLWADELALKDSAPKSYFVKKGDTLWDISGVFLKQPWLWPKLWRLNPEVSNPHLIYPGEELRLVFDEKGEPMLIRGKPELKWSPKVRQQLKEQQPISTLPLHLIAPYLKYDMLATEQQLESSAYILSNEEGTKYSADGLKLFAKGKINVGHSYAIYKKGDEVIDPESDNSLGFHLILVGTAKAMASNNEEENTPATLYVENAKQEIDMGDYVMPINEKLLLPSIFMISPVAEGTEGLILKSFSGLREFGKLDVILINRGEEHGITPGNVFTVKRLPPGVIETSDGPVLYEDASMWHRLLSTEEKSDFNMPVEAIGEMMVFKVYEKASLALILRSTKPLRMQDTVGAP